MKNVLVAFLAAALLFSGSPVRVEAKSPITGGSMLLVPLVLAIPAIIIGVGFWLSHKGKPKAVAAQPGVTP